MGQYTEFMDKYAAYEDKYMEKTALIENILPYVAQHIPQLANHLPPEGVIGLVGTASKLIAMRGLGRATKAISDTMMLKRKFRVGAMDAFKMRGTPAANIALGKGLPAAPQGKIQKTLGILDKASDAGSVGYNALLLGKHLL